MKSYRFAVVLAVALALLAGAGVAGEKEQVKSGPQVGEKLAGPFHPLNINGDKAGEKNCLYCSNGDHPVAMVFAREVSKPLTRLIKRIDACTAKNAECEMGSFVVFLSSDEGLEGKLKDLAKEANLKHTILSIDNPAGPKGYKVAEEADVTVVLYTNRTAKANFAFKKGEMTDADVDRIMKDIPKILPKK